LDQDVPGPPTHRMGPSPSTSAATAASRPSSLGDLPPWSWFSVPCSPPWPGPRCSLLPLSSH